MMIILFQFHKEKLNSSQKFLSLCQPGCQMPVDVVELEKYLAKMSNKTFAASGSNWSLHLLWN